MKRFFGHNFGVVYRFEVTRTLKKKSFWLTMFALPALLVAIFGVIILSNNQAEQSAKDLSSQQFSIGVTDDSQIISPAILDGLKAKTIANRDEGVDLVMSGKLDAYFYYPKDLKISKVEVYGKSVGIFENSRYQSVAQTILQQSATSQTNPEVVSVLSNQTQFSSKTFRDGKEYDPMMEMIAPGIFLVLLYITIAMFGNQMLNATVEEKENRVIEIILTTIKSRTLIVGKTLAILTLILIQTLVILCLIIATYLLLKNQLNLPNIDLSNIPFDWARIAAAFGLFIGGILLLSGLLVAIGAAVPTAKEAAQFMGIVMVLLFGPLYAAPLFVTNPDSLAVVVLSFFPFTAPIPLLLRNAVGNLTAIETIAGVGMLLLFAAIVFIVAAKLFQTGAVEYDRKLSPKVLLSKSKKPKASR